VRTESEKEIEFLQYWLKRYYESLGYVVINIPAMPIAEQVNFILKIIKRENE